MLYIVFTHGEVTVNHIMGLLGPKLGENAFRANSLWGDGYCIGIIVPDVETEEVVRKLVEGGVELEHINAFPSITVTRAPKDSKPGAEV